MRFSWCLAGSSSGYLHWNKFALNSCCSIKSYLSNKSHLCWHYTFFYQVLSTGTTWLLCCVCCHCFFYHHCCRGWFCSDHFSASFKLTWTGLRSVKSKSKGHSHLRCCLNCSKMTHFWVDCEVKDCADAPVCTQLLHACSAAPRSWEVTGRTK